MGTGRTEVLLDGLWYANGVAVGPDDAGGGEGRYVLVVETLGFRVLRKWISGPRARPGPPEPSIHQSDSSNFSGAAKEEEDKQGKEEEDGAELKKDSSVDVLIDGLPGFPDGVALAADHQHAWVSLVAPLSPPLLRLLLGGASARWTWIRAGLLQLSITLGLSKYLVKHWGCVIKVSLRDGSIVDVLFDATATRVATISAVTEQPARVSERSHSGGSDSSGSDQDRDRPRLWLGNLGGQSVSVVDMDLAATPPS
jgi:hypothetical protein